MTEDLHTQADFCRAGCTSSRGARFWEDQGLLGVVARSDAGVRRYTDEQMRYAAIIAAAQFGGWSIERIKEMIEGYDVDPEIHDALVTRLADQVRAAARLADELPKPRHLETPSLEYDL
jgi:DNA-binding transcriptional MerR regulator